MFRMWDVGDEGCLGCWMFGMWYVQDVEYSKWDIRDLGYLEFGLFRMWDAGDVRCCRCLMFGIVDVWGVGC